MSRIGSDSSIDHRPVVSAVTKPAEPKHSRVSQPTVPQIVYRLVSSTEGWSTEDSLDIGGLQGKTLEKLNTQIAGISGMFVEALEISLTTCCHESKWKLRQDEELEYKLAVADFGAKIKRQFVENRNKNMPFVLRLKPTYKSQPREAPMTNIEDMDDFAF
jgi:hypothetical protein